MRKLRLFLIVWISVLLWSCGAAGTIAPSPTVPASGTPAATAVSQRVPTKRPVGPAPDERTLTATTTPPLPTSTATPNVILDPRCIFPNRKWDISATIRDTEHDPDFWQFSTPEEQGIDSTLLNKGLAGLAESPAIRSFLIIRHDHIVVEQYFNRQDATRSYEIASVSKSIISALVGIALREGYIENLDQKVADFLPQYFVDANTSKKRITLRHLLTMRAGLVWEPTTPLDKIRNQHLLPTIIDLPLKAAPGSQFIYSTGLPYLMSAVLTNATGMSTCEFAYKYLFDPLDITVEFWGQDADGYYTGGWYMYLTPRELAKFGLLYLHQGQWNGKQVIPQDWVKESLVSHVTLDSLTRYGYWWWITSLPNASGSKKHDIYSARGGGEQMIHIIPDLDMVVVTMSDHLYQGSSEGIDSFDFIEHYVLPAIATDG